MVLPILALAIGGAAFAAHRTGVLHKIAARVSLATAAYAATAPSTSSTNNSDSSNASVNAAYRQYEGGFSNPMIYKEAKMMLGYDENDRTAPEPKDVTKRHRTLMAKFHTDVGGSDMICQKLNIARDTIVPK